MEAKEKAVRNSNIELLRIFSMLFIVIYHCLGRSLGTNPDWEFLRMPIISVLHIGVICFVLISGYWGIRFSLKGFFKLIIQCSFYSILIYLVYILLNPEIYSLKGLIKSAIPVQWWFINIYLCLYLLIPIINIPLKTSTTKKKIIFICFLGVISFVFQYVPSLSNGKNPVNFILIYYIGDFIRYNLKISPNLGVKRLLIIYGLFNILLFSSLLLLSDIPLVRKVLFHLTFPYNSIGLIFNAICFFLIFCKLEIKSKVINWIAISILPVYLLHENKYIGSYLYKFVNGMQDFINNPIFFILSIGLLGVIVLLACICIDKLINPFIKFIGNIVLENKLFKKIDNKVNAILD
jgi:surface polysaccharide O-acyltransferase-like enzyme